MPPKGISIDLDNEIQSAVKCFYNNAFYLLKKQIADATTAFVKRELEEYVDVILKFHPYDNIVFTIGHDIEVNDMIKGYIGGQVRKFWQQQKFDDCEPMTIDMTKYQKLFNETRESTLKEDIEFDDMVDAYDGDVEKALAIPQQFDYNDQFAEFFELAYSKGLLHNGEEIIYMLDPKNHYQLLKQYLL